MSAYIARRLVLMVPTLLGVTIILFFVVRAVPGGPAAIFCSEICSEQQLAKIEEDLGLNKPIYEQYGTWIVDVAQGDFGRSFQTNLRVNEQIRDKLPVTIELGILSLLIASLIAIPVGIISAVKQDTAWDYAARATAFAMLAIPYYWVALLAIGLGSRYGFWTPALNYTSFADDPLENLRIMLPPAFLLGLALTGAQMRLVRANMLDVLRQDYIRTARSKGLSTRTVVFRHAFRNALIPSITLLGSQVPVVIGGTVILETIFSIPGMGRYLIDAVNSGDVPIIQGINLIFAIAVVAVNLTVDVTYSVVDPRIRYR